MSNLIYEGDILANFGRYLPTPYIQSIIIDADSSETMKMTVNLYIHVDASEYSDDITLEEQIEKLHFYWMLSDTLLEDNQFVFDLVNTDGSNIFLIERADIEDSKTLLYDSEGNKIIKYIIAETYSNPDSETWDAFPNLYVYAFSTSEDLSEAYWNPLDSGYPVDDGDHWKEFLKAETSDVAYEHVMENGSIPDPTETIWVDANDAAYADTPLQAITSLYYKSNKITHEEIVESFQDLVAEYQEESETDSHLKDVLDNISYLLEIYGNEVELLPKLNEFRRAFPSKTSATSTGRVYLKYRKKIYTANSIMELDEQVYKKIVQNSKIIDDRDHLFSTFDELDLSSVCIEDCTDECELVSNFTFDRQQFLTDDMSLGANYGFFFFDYEKAQTFTSNAATLASIDINKVKEVWGESIFNLTYQLTEVKLERQYTTLSVGPFGALIEMAGATSPLMEMVADYEYDNAFPEMQMLEHTYYGDWGPAAGYYEYTQSFETDFDTSGMTAEEAGEVEKRQLAECTAKSFLALRNFDLAPESDGADSALGDYGLMCFEFQDLMSWDVVALGTTDEEKFEYVATVTIEDNTLDIFTAIIEVFGTFSVDFEAYYDAATEACAYNSDDGVFNDYFINWAAEEWPDLATSPWVMAAAVYYLYIDLLEGVFGGDYDLIALATQTMANAISPYSGTLDQLVAFYEAFVVLQDIVNAIETGDELTGYEILKEFTCTQDITVHPMFVSADGTTCDLVHTEVWETSEGREEDKEAPGTWTYIGHVSELVGWEYTFGDIPNLQQGMIDHFDGHWWEDPDSAGNPNWTDTIAELACVDKYTWLEMEPNFLELDKGTSLVDWIGAGEPYDRYRFAWYGWLSSVDHGAGIPVSEEECDTQYRIVWVAYSPGTSAGSVQAQEWACFPRGAKCEEDISTDLDKCSCGTSDAWGDCSGELEDWAERPFCARDWWLADATAEMTAAELAAEYDTSWAGGEA